MTALRHIVDSVADAGLRLHKSSPLDSESLSLELHDARGALVTGLWHDDLERSASLARKAAQVSPPADVALLNGTGVVLLRRGADFRLRSLGELARAPGAALVAHRAGRRGVVRMPTGCFTKVVVPRKAPRLARALQVAPDPSVLQVPRVLGTDSERGTVTMACLPGRTFHDVLGDRRLRDGQVAEGALAIGRALAHFHGLRPSAEAATHDAAAEATVTRLWLERASHFGVLSRDRWSPAMARVTDLLDREPDARARLHRDLHDKQLMLAPGEPVGLLDLDLAAAGEAALDLANLLAHLELRTLQGWCSNERADRCGSALLDGYRPSAHTLSRIPAYLAASRLRLAAVYAFRDAPLALIEQLITRTEEFPHD